MPFSSDDDARIAFLHPRRGRVLIVDDSASDLRLLAAIVEGLGWTSVCVASGAAAVNACETEGFVAILMDVNMPSMNGIEAVRAIRAKTEWADEAPIVAISASMSRALRAEARAAGVDACLAKPARPAEIADALRAAFVARSDLRARSA